MSRYTRYGGGDPLAGPPDLTEALAAIAEDVMAGYSPERAMREYLRRSGQRPGAQRGLDDLAGRVAARRRQLLHRHDLSGTLREVRDLLDAAVLAERGELARDPMRDEADRAWRELRLAELPDSTAAAVADLADYDWASAEARQRFEEIRDLLGRELLEQRFAGMKKALQEAGRDAGQEDRDAITAMLRDLNDLLEKHAAGQAGQADFEKFMAAHGQHFPERPQSLEELLDALAARSAAAQRMLNSMTPEQRAELAALSAQAFGSPELMRQLSRMEDNLRALRPGEDWTGAESFEGDSPLGLGEATGVMSELAELDALSEQLAQSYDGARLDDLDLDALARQLGPEAAADAAALQRLEQALRGSGYLRRGSSGDLRLSPKAMRQLGRTLLRDVARRLDGRAGTRESRRAGPAGDASGGSRAWAFGDTEPWDVPRTLANSLRSGHRSGGRGGLRVGPGDIEVVETEARTRAAVALLVDTSFSMAAEGRWVPMKRTALALHTLVRTRFRGDALQLISFGRAARVLDIDELTALEAYRDKGTNLHHALLLANRFFRRHPNAQPVLLIVTDGEPTSHLEPDGEVWFDYPPHPLTIAYAVRELDQSGRFGARVTFFRLGDDPGLARFVASMARRVDGEVVSPETEELGAAVVGSFLRDRHGPPGSR